MLLEKRPDQGRSAEGFYKSSSSSSWLLEDGIVQRLHFPGSVSTPAPSPWLVGRKPLAPWCSHRALPIPAAMQEEEVTVCVRCRCRERLGQPSHEAQGEVLVEQDDSLPDREGTTRTQERRRPGVLPGYTPGHSSCLRHWRSLWHRCAVGQCRGRFAGE